MLTVIIPSNNQDSELAQTLSVLVSGAVEGLVREVIVLDQAGNPAVAHIADAAGCTYHTQWDLRTILSGARSEWLLFIESGARPQPGWIEILADCMAIGRSPARFTAARSYRGSLLRRLVHRKSGLECGLLVTKGQAVAHLKVDMQPADIARGLKMRRLSAELIPSWVMRTVG